MTNCSPAEVAARAGVAEGTLFQAALRADMEEPHWLQGLAQRVGHPVLHGVAAFRAGYFSGGPSVLGVSPRRGVSRPRTMKGAQ